ncbi:MAG: class I SAM-dependent methyltransferase [Chroococcidiopsidaceae cyanobacterium CP_BM_ER_R8_30]|nr:class I SAM-dependent methyltransferase [Chroococcidiopsidaceae cyanobacterium CP_BM_ER_R8_30]
MSKSFFPIECLSDTAYGVAYCRAMETERPDAHFQDIFARELAGKRGKLIMETTGESSSWLFVVRTCIIDKLILESIEKKGIDTVINLGAGLDTRPYRLSLPSSLHWIDVDLPSILDYKEQKLASQQPICFLESVKLDVTDITLSSALFTRINAEAKQVLVITEGLLVYLTSEQVALLTIILGIQPNFRWWILDLVSPLSLKLARTKYVKELTAANAIQQFAPSEGTDFFQSYGWKVVKFQSLLKEAHRLKRKPALNWLWQQLPCFKNEGVVLLRRT